MPLDKIFEQMIDDKKYKSLKNKLKKLDEKTLSEHTSFNFHLTIEYATEALELSKKILTYSISKGYSDYLIERYGNDMNEMSVKKHEESVEFYKIYSIYQSANGYEKLKDYNKAIELYLSILNEYTPRGTLYYERPAILLEKGKRYKEAIEVCKKAIQAIEDNKFHATKDEFEHRLNRLIEKMNKPYKLQKSLKPKSKNNPVTKEVIVAPSTDVPQQIINFPDWYVSISFGVSRSQNYPQAVALAKIAPQYIENNIEGKILHQAVYSDKSKEYLQFIKLYELINQWKSCFVVINGEVIDRKIVGGLNYCYGDKCRSGKPDFCYGASPMTVNPFGCHRLQISTYNNPWWSFGSYDDYGIWHIDKNSILRRIDEFSLPYQMCPCFSIDNIKSVVSSLPDEINPKKDYGWTAFHNGIQPSDYNVISSIVVTPKNSIDEAAVMELVGPTNIINTPKETSDNADMQENILHHDNELEILPKKKGLFSSLISLFKK